MVSFGAAIKLGFKNAFKFKGTATRAEYWWFYLFAYIIGVAANLIDAMLGLDTMLGGVGNAIGGPLSLVASLVLFVPQLSILVRRFRDTKVSPFWLISALIPITGLATWLTNHMDLLNKIIYLGQTDDTAATDAFVNQLVNDPASEQTLGQFLIIILLLALYGIFQLVVTLLPSKAPKQPVVATIDY